jgi:hypothetical protein
MIHHHRFKCIFTFRVDKTKQDKTTSRGTSEMKSKMMSKKIEASKYDS